MTFGDRLTQLRKEKGYKTRKEFSEILNIPETTLRNYETDVREPGHTFLKQMSDFFNVSSDYLLGLTTEREKYSTHQLKSSEFEHIEKYRSLDPYGKETVSYILDRECERVSSLQKQKERIEELESENTPQRIIAYYQRLASAGSGDYLFDDIPTDFIRVRSTAISRQADFVIGVNGRSMEDTYHDGDRVFVKKLTEIDIGDIGVFTRGNDCFIKELGTDRLISHNQDKDAYPDIPASDDIRLVGKVLGIVDE